MIGDAQLPEIERSPDWDALGVVSIWLIGGNAREQADGVELVRQRRLGR